MSATVVASALNLWNAYDNTKWTAKMIILNRPVEVSQFDLSVGSRHMDYSDKSCLTENHLLTALVSDVPQEFSRDSSRSVRGKRFA